MTSAQFSTSPRSSGSRSERDFFHHPPLHRFRDGYPSWLAGHTFCPVSHWGPAVSSLPGRVSWRGHRPDNVAGNRRHRETAALHHRITVLYELLMGTSTGPPRSGRSQSHRPAGRRSARAGCRLFARRVDKIRATFDLGIGGSVAPSFAHWPSRGRRQLPSLSTMQVSPATVARA